MSGTCQKASTRKGRRLPISIPELPFRGGLEFSRVAICPLGVGTVHPTKGFRP